MNSNEGSCSSSDVIKTSNNSTTNAVNQAVQVVGLRIIEKGIRQTYVDAKKVFKPFVNKDSRLSATQFAEYYRNKFIIPNPDPNAEAVDKYNILSNGKKKPSNAHPSIQMSIQNYLESNRFPLESKILEETGPLSWGEELVR